MKQFLWRGRRQFYREFWALRDVSLAVDRGETVGIVGRNGSGKSTLLQIICGTLTPTTGEIHVGGRIGALLELGAGFNPEFTGRENVYVLGSLMDFPQKEIACQMDRIRDFADIGLFFDKPIRTYSSGMVARLAFAVYTCLEPDILIVDEVINVGDAEFKQKCSVHMANQTAKGWTAARRPWSRVAPGS